MSEPEAPTMSRSLRLGVGAAVVVIIGVFAVVVGMGVLSSAGEKVGPKPFAAATAGSVYVHVSGAVAKPGVYVLAGGARAVDAIAAAGGLNADAETSRINLARVVADGEQLVVPAVAVAAPGEAGAAASSSVDDGIVNINTATVAELDTLPRVGEAMAKRIVAWREEKGPFSSVDDLNNVSGIGPKMLESIRPLVRVG